MSMIVMTEVMLQNPITIRAAREIVKKSSLLVTSLAKPKHPTLTAYTRVAARARGSLPHLLTKGLNAKGPRK